MNLESPFFKNDEDVLCGPMSSSAQEILSNTRLGKESMEIGNLGHDVQVCFDATSKFLRAAQAHMAKDDGMADKVDRR